jgi:glyoxylase-like metal-dependent hydrolase (beta-lactamase superfamily II)
MTLTVDSLELGPVATNCYIVRADPGASAAVVVDPGAEAHRVLQLLERLRVRVEAVLVTHTHYDHIGGVADVAEATGAPVYAPAGEAMVLEDPDRFYGALGLSIRPWTAQRYLEGGEQLELAGMDVDTLSVPGHSPAHLAFHHEGALLSGDVLFAGSVGRTDLPGASWGTLLDSIRLLTDSFPPRTVVYPGHGPSTTLGAELARNPFLAELRAS